MLPQKSYCFVSYDSVEEASCAVQHLNGYHLECSEQRKNDVVLYTLFVSKGRFVYKVKSHFWMLETIDKLNNP